MLNSRKKNLYETPRDRIGGNGESATGRGVVLFDFVFAVLVMVVFMHFSFVVVTEIIERNAQAVERQIVFEKTASFADFLVKEGFALDRGGGIAQHETDSVALLRTGEMIGRAKEFGLREPGIEIELLSAVKIAGGQNAGGGESRVCVSRFVLLDKEPARMVVCSEG